MKKITSDGEIIDEITYETVAMAPPFFKTPWNHDTDREAASVALECKDPSRTQQQFAKDADINVILAKFLKTGELMTVGAPTYQDALEIFDLQDSIVTRAQVDEAWNALPAAVRNTLKDPHTFTQYIAHCMQTEDLDPLRELGLANPVSPVPVSTEEPISALKPLMEAEKEP